MTTESKLFYIMVVVAIILAVCSYIQMGKYPELVSSAFAYQPKPVDFWVNPEGEAFGILEDGSTFSQTNVVTDLGIRLQRFQWGEMFWYVSDKGEIFADYDLQAFSIYLAKE